MNYRAYGLIAALLLATFSINTAGAEVRRERPTRRPYIIEIGEPYSITNTTLRAEASKNSELRDYLNLHGRPDFAEIQEVAPDWPWETYEVRVYYLRRNVQADFGTVPFSPAAPSFGVMKFQGGIPASKRHEIELALQPEEGKPAVSMATDEPVVTSPPAAEPTSIEAIVARMEAAAERAAQAADKAAEQSAAAERAAMRTVAVVDKLAETQR